jgi:hypothetical protein
MAPFLQFSAEAQDISVMPCVVRIHFFDKGDSRCLGDQNRWDYGWLDLPGSS